MRTVRKGRRKCVRRIRNFGDDALDDFDMFWEHEAILLLPGHAPPKS